MQYPELKRLIQIIEKLRHPTQGCPWDLKQTHKSLTRFLIEESYEFLYAVENETDREMEEEIGDVLLQVLLHSQIASERRAFDLESVAKRLAQKMIERHPHVFDETKNRDDLQAQDIQANWQQQKRQESKRFFKVEDAYMPALMAAQKIGAKSKQVNFDWENVAQVMAKVHEELREVEDELEKEKINPSSVQEEIGDLLFSTAQLARHLNIDPEIALRQANLKFIKRFEKMEELSRLHQKDMRQMSVEQLEELWQTVKEKDKSKDKL